MIKEGELQNKITVGIIGTVGYSDGNFLKIIRDQSGLIEDVEIFNQLNILVSDVDDREVNCYSKDPELSLSMINAFKMMEKTGCQFCVLSYPSTKEFVEKTREISEEIFVVDLVEEVEKFLKRKKVKKVYLIGDERDVELYRDRFCSDIEIMGSSNRENMNYEQKDGYFYLCVTPLIENSIEKKSFTGSLQCLSEIVEVLYKFLIHKLHPNIEKETIHRVKQPTKEMLETHKEILKKF